MKEIKFRIYLQHQDTGYITSKEFDYAEIFSGDAKNQLIKMRRYAVIGKSEYTDIKDRNGTEIYDGDILKITTANMVLIGIGKGIPKKSYDDLHSSLGEVYIEPGMTLVRYFPSKSYRGHLVTVIAQASDSGGNIEVIGNVHENPELLQTNP